MIKKHPERSGGATRISNEEGVEILITSQLEILDTSLLDLEKDLRIIELVFRSLGKQDKENLEQALQDLALRFEANTQKLVILVPTAIEYFGGGFNAAELRIFRAMVEEIQVSAAELSWEAATKTANRLRLTWMF